MNRKPPAPFRMAANLPCSLVGSIMRRHYFGPAFHFMKNTTTASTIHHATQSITAKPPSWTARMMAHDVAEGLPDFANPRLRTIIDTLMPPDTAELTRKLLEKTPLEMTAYIRALLLFRNTLPFFRRFSLRHFSNDKDYINGALRKRFFYDETVSAIKRGAKQVITMGAGYDVLCLQLCRQYPDVLFVEVDQQNTQRIKSHAVRSLHEGHEGNIPENLAFVSVDFRHQTLATELKTQLQGRWQPQRLSVSLVEGVWPYLAEQEIRASLQSFKQISAAGSIYVFTYFALSGNRLQRKLTTASTGVFSLIGEPVRYLPDSVGEIASLLNSEDYDADLSAQRTNGYARYIIPAGFDDYVTPERVLSNFVGVATLRP